MITYKIKDWATFQHFKDRKPPWIKLYRTLLDDLDWHNLDPKSAKILVMLWLIASESDGTLPCVKTLAFRLRMTEKVVSDALSSLSHYLIQDDISVISEGYQSDSLEREGETKEEGETKGAQPKKPMTDTQKAERIYKEYPKQVGRGKAIASIVTALKNGADPNIVINAVIAYGRATKSWTAEDRQYIPNPATWFNQERWTDDQDQWRSKSANVAHTSEHYTVPAKEAR
tara:strand:- start:277 stop:963 length:687 start_codon:yes stop_codon:yes gene_type:complete